LNFAKNILLNTEMSSRLCFAD